MAAEILEASASGFAAAANAHLQSASSSETAWDAAAWLAHLKQRVLELAAAVRVGDPAMFRRRVEWLRRAARARGAGDSEIVQALTSLRDALREELPAPMHASVLPVIELALTASPADESDVSADAGDAYRKLALGYMEACLDGRPDDAVKLIMDAIPGELSPQEAYCRVIATAQNEIGRLWHIGEVSIAEERLVSETTRRVMAKIAIEHGAGKKLGLTVLAASVAGNAHDMGLRIVTDLFALAGWKSLFLGANVPAADIAAAADNYAADLVVLTATLETQLNAMAMTIREVRKEAPTAKILVGGIAFDDSPDLWKTVGADGFAASFEEAVERGASLLTH